MQKTFKRRFQIVDLNWFFPNKTVKIHQSKRVNIRLCASNQAPLGGSWNSHGLARSASVAVARLEVLRCHIFSYFFGGSMWLQSFFSNLAASFRSKQGEQGSMARGLSLLDDAAPLSRERWLGEGPIGWTSVRVQLRLRSNTPSLLTLLELQGLVVPDDGDIMSVQLKPHGCWKEKKFDGLGLHSGTMRSRKILSRGGTWLGFFIVAAVCHSSSKISPLLQVGKRVSTRELGETDVASPQWRFPNLLEFVGCFVGPLRSAGDSFECLWYWQEHCHESLGRFHANFLDHWLRPHFFYIVLSAWRTRYWSEENCSSLRRELDAVRPGFDCSGLAVCGHGLFHDVWLWRRQLVTQLADAADLASGPDHESPQASARLCSFPRPLTLPGATGRAVLGWLKVKGIFSKSNCVGKIINMTFPNV